MTKISKWFTQVYGWIKLHPFIATICCTTLILFFLTHPALPIVVIGVYLIIYLDQQSNSSAQEITEPIFEYLINEIFKRFYLLNLVHFSNDTLYQLIYQKDSIFSFDQNGSVVEFTVPKKFIEKSVEVSNQIMLYEAQQVICRCYVGSNQIFDFQISDFQIQDWSTYYRFSLTFTKNVKLLTRDHAYSIKDGDF